MRSRIAIVTGSSTGIGAATAKRLSATHAGIVLHARKSMDALERVAEAVRANGAEVETVLGDLVEEDLGERLVRTAVERFGRLDSLVANAGFPIIKSLEEANSADLRYAFNGNALSFFSIVRAAGDLLGASPAGRIVAVSSFTAHVFRTNLRTFPVSAASKGALETAVKSIAMELSTKGITVNCVVPGSIRKDPGTLDGVSDNELESNRLLIPLRRIGEPEDIAGAIAFLLSDDASYITGQAIHVNGGLFM